MQRVGIVGALAVGGAALIFVTACGGGGAAAPAATPVPQAPVANKPGPGVVAKPTATANATREAQVAAAAVRGTDAAVAANATREAQAVVAQSAATAAADARGQAAATATSVAEARAAAATETARPAPTPVLPAGLNPLAGLAPDTAAAVPLSSTSEGLLLLRDFPQLLTDDLLLPWLTTHIRTEAGMWPTVDCFGRAVSQPCGMAQLFANAKFNPTRSTFVYEWQKAMEQTPDLARGPLLDVFVRPDADWSFVKREAEWDDAYANYVQVFLFKRESVEGRQPEFAARELLPLFRQHFEAVAARTPNTFWFNAPINLKYDFATGTFRSTLPSGSIDLLNSQPFTRVGPGNDGYLSLGDLPESVRGRANYNLALAQPPGRSIPTDNDGIHIPGLVLRVNEELLPATWQNGFNMVLGGQLGGQTRLPPLAVLSTDRQLQIPPIAMEPARAEAITKQLAAGGSVRAKVFVTIDHALTFNWGTGANSRGQQALLTASVLKVELILTPSQHGGAVPVQDELLGTYS
jgi:hypothetical protein